MVGDYYISAPPNARRIIMNNNFNLTGRQFGRLLIMERSAEKHRKDNHAYYLCKCDCGQFTEASSSNLKQGRTRSCGCLFREVVCERLSKIATEHPAYKHGEAGQSGGNRSGRYNILASMKQRCYNPKNKDYKYYGRKGVQICPEWINKKTGFIAFRDWATFHGFKPGLCIHRKDSSGDYKPSNCEWLSKSEHSKGHSKEGE